MASEPADAASEPGDQAPHYVRAVADMGETREVVAREDIHAANGVKLLARGAKVDRRMLDRLLQHKLALPLDAALDAADALDHAALARDMDAALGEDEMLQRLLQRAGDDHGWKWTLSRMPLHREVSFRLTVMKSERPRLYGHSLKLALLAHAIAARLPLPAEEMDMLMLAALCHDFGEMHTDPELLKSGRPLRGRARNVIHVHPVTSHAILSRVPAIPAAVLRAVLQHHERLDGSGYPTGAAGAKIHPHARILAVAETVEVMLRRFDPERFGVVFRLHRVRLDADCIRAVYELLPPDAQASAEAQQAQAGSPSRVMRLLAAWPDLQRRIESAADDAELAFVASRLFEVQSLARQAGLSAEFLEMIDLDGEDALLAGELLAVEDEMARMLDDIAFEIERRIAPSMPGHALARELIAWLRQPPADAP
jgi:HD-GYP domain-containing protein (c-di-GMP phosphodiesterase class II)